MAAAQPAGPLPLANEALQVLSGSIVNWINSGFDGSPAFVQDLKEHFHYNAHADHAHVAQKGHNEGNAQQVLECGAAPDFEAEVQGDDGDGKEDGGACECPFGP